MQLKYFSNGGYVVHKAYLCGTKYSAWFDGDGDLLDAERFDSRGRSYKVSLTSIAAKSLQSVYGGKQNFEEWHAPHCAQNTAI